MRHNVGTDPENEKGVHVADHLLRRTAGFAPNQQVLQPARHDREPQSYPEIAAMQ